MLQTNIHISLYIKDLRDVQRNLIGMIGEIEVFKFIEEVSFCLMNINGTKIFITVTSFSGKTS